MGWQFVRWACDGSEIFDSETDEAIARVADHPDELTRTRLIAAAPDLLAALEAVIDDLEGGIIIGEEEGASRDWLASAEVRLKNARAAIAKATGASC